MNVSKLETNPNTNTTVLKKNSGQFSYIYDERKNKIFIIGA